MSKPGYFFERVSSGPTYKVRVPEDIVESHAQSKPHTMYITINDDDDGPFEIFVRYDVPEYYELITVITRMSSMALREGVDANIVAKELQEIFSPKTNHMIPGSDKMAISLTSRIGDGLQQHIESQQKAAA